MISTIVFCDGRIKLTKKDVIEKINKENISFISFHDINMTTKKVETIDVSEANDLKEYIIGKLKYIIDLSKNCREFELNSTERDTYDKIIESLNNIDDLEILNEQAEILAKKLLTKQNNTTSDGGLVQAIFTHNNMYYYVFIKNEFEDVIERADMKKVDAFIYGEKAPLKTALFEIKKEDVTFKVNQIFVDDSQTSPFAQFWYNDFLNLIPKRDDKSNTTNFLESIQSYWSEVDEEYLINTDNPDIQEEASSIRFELENHSKGFLVDKRTFRLTDYLESLSEENLGMKLNNLDEIKRGFIEMAEDEFFGFDKTFDIDKPVLNKKRYKYAYKPQKNVELSISGRIDSNLVYIKKEKGEYILNIVVDQSIGKEILNSIKVKE